MWFPVRCSFANLKHAAVIFTQQRLYFDNQTKKVFKKLSQVLTSLFLFCRIVRWKDSQPTQTGHEGAKSFSGGQNSADPRSPKRLLTMSDISVNINPSAEAAQTRAPNKHCRRRRWLQKKRRHLEENDSMEGKLKKKRKRRKKFVQHQSSEAEQRTLFSAPFKKLEFPNSKYKSLSFTQNNFLPSSGSSSKASTSTENSISSAPTSSSFKASTSAGNKTVSPSSSSAFSSFKPPTSEPNDGLPHLNSSASTHSLPSSNNKHLYDTPKELWSAALAAAAAAPASSVTSSHKQATSKTSAAAGIPTKYLAIDCEMVGTGPKGSISQLARCSVVNYEGDVVYDKFINPSMPVTDYRTKWSGIRRCDLVNATPYAVARKEVREGFRTGGCSWHRL